MLRKLSGPRAARGGFFVVLALICSSLAAQEAETKKESSNAARVKFSDAAELQNEGLFELAISEYRDFLKEFPDDPLAIKARHYLGICLLQEKQFAEAATELSQVVSGDPKFELLDETLLSLGSAQFNVASAGKDAKQFGAAAETYGKLVTQFPKSKLLASALFNQGEAYYAMSQREKAAAAYGQLLEQFPDHKLQPDAAYALGVTQLELGQAAKAQATLDAFLTANPDHKLASQVNMYKADALFEQKKYAEAEKLYATVAATEGFDLADRCTMRRGDCLTNLKKYGPAADMYASVAENYPKSSQVPAAQLAAGSRYNLADNHEKAVTWLAKVGGKDAPEAAHWLARSYLALKKPAEALAAVEKVLPKAQKSDFLVDLLLDQADAAYEVPDRKKDAVGLYAAVAENHPKHKKAPTALYYAAWAAFNQNDYDTALKHANQFLADHADHDLKTSTQSVAADSYLNTSKFSEAEHLYSELLKDQADHAEAPRWRLLQGWTLFRQKKFDDTVSHLEGELANLQDESARAEALYLLGASSFALKKYGPARDSLDKSLKADAKSSMADEAMLLLSRAQRQSDDPKLALTTVQRLIDEFPDSSLLDRAHYYLAEYLYGDGDFKKAAAQYEKMLADFPKSDLVPASLYWLGWSRLSAKDYDGANKALTQLIAEHGNDKLAGSAHYARAQARRLSGDNAAAIEDVNAFLATNPDPAERSGALFERGLAETDLKKMPAAIESFQSILKDDPKYAAADKVKYQLAWSLKEAGREDEAAETFQQLATDHPKSPFAAEGLYHIAEKQYANQEYAKAAEGYTAAIEKAGSGQPEIAEMATHKLGWSQYHQNDYQAAHQTFTGQLAAHANGKLAADARFMAAESLFKQEDHARALEAFNAVRDNPPASKDFQLLALLHAGQSAGQLKQWDASLTFLEECREKFADSPYHPDTLYEIAWAKQNKGELDDALALYEEVTDMTRREVGARARLMMGEIKFEKGEHKQAVVDFFKVFRGYKGAPESYNRWKAQSLYEAARCFEVMKNTPYAKKYYQQLVEDYPDSQLVKLAKERIEAL